MLTEYSDEFDTLGRLVGIFIVAPLMYNAGVTGATDGLIKKYLIHHFLKISLLERP